MFVFFIALLANEASGQLGMSPYKADCTIKGYFHGYSFHVAKVLRSFIFSDFATVVINLINPDQCDIPQDLPHSTYVTSNPLAENYAEGSIFFNMAKNYVSHPLSRSVINKNWNDAIKDPEFRSVLRQESGNQTSIKTSIYQTLVYLTNNFTYENDSHKAGYGWNRILHVHLFHKSPNTITNYVKILRLFNYIDMTKLRYLLNPIFRNDFIQLVDPSQKDIAKSDGFSRPFDIFVTICLTAETTLYDEFEISYWMKTLTSLIDSSNFLHQTYFNKVWINLPHSVTSPQNVTTFVYCQYCNHYYSNWIPSNNIVKRLLRFGYGDHNKILNVKVSLYMAEYIPFEQAVPSVFVLTLETLLPERMYHKNLIERIGMYVNIPLLDLLIYEAATPENVSNYYRKFDNNVYILTNSKQAMTIVTGTVGIQFITCDGGYVKDGMSFAGFISAFDLPTWICILVVFKLMAVIFYNEKNYENIKDQFKSKLYYYVISMVKVVRLFLFQGSEFAGTRLRLPVQIFSVCIFIIGYFYLGDNIGELTAPKSMVHYKSFNELLNRNFTWIVQRRFSFYEHMACVAKFGLKNLTKHEKSCIFGADSSFREYAPTLYKNVVDISWSTKETKEEKILQRVSEAVYEFNDNYTLQQLAANFLPERCPKSAIVDWSDQIKGLYNPFMLSILNQSLDKDPIFSKSQESFLEHNNGWLFSEWGNPWTLGRFKAMWSSGIDKFFSSQLDRLEELKFTKEKQIVMEHKGDMGIFGKFTISLTANTVVIFIAGGMGVMVASLVLIWECHDRILRKACIFTTQLRDFIYKGFKYCFKTFKTRLEI